MQTPTNRSFFSFFSRLAVFVALIGLGMLLVPRVPVGPWGGKAFAQTTERAGSRKPALGRVGNRSSVLRGRMAEGAGGAAKSDASSAEPADAADTEETDAGSSGGMGQSIKQFIRSYATWIVVPLVLLAGVALIWAYLGMRGRKGGGDDSLSELGFEEIPASAGPGPRERSQRYSSTKIQKRDVKSGLSGSRTMRTMEVETDREYALVVDKEDLAMPPLPEGEEEDAGELLAASQKIEDLLHGDKAREAHAEYKSYLEQNSRARFPAELESALGERLMRMKEYPGAAKVLEHYVVTHGVKEIAPETYFNLGYVHFMNRTLNKSRRFFRLFIKTEKNPEYVARAQRILQKIDSSSPRK